MQLIPTFILLDHTWSRQGWSYRAEKCLFFMEWQAFGWSARAHFKGLDLVHPRGIFDGRCWSCRLWKIVVNVCTIGGHDSGQRRGQCQGKGRLRATASLDAKCHFEEQRSLWKAVQERFVLKGWCFCFLFEVGDLDYFVYLLFLTWGGIFNLK